MVATTLLTNLCPICENHGHSNFLKHFITNPSKVGALAPSSHALAVQITDRIPDRSHTDANESGMRFLEIGAGTGVFTREIIKKLGPSDCLDVVESNPEFCTLLRQEFQNFPQVKIHEISFTDFESNPYDAIISGLPLNAFKPEYVAAILKKYEELTKPGGVVSYFEYIVLEKIKKAFLFGEAYERFSQVLRHKEIFVQKHHATHTHVLLNFPPARVQFCSIRKD